MTNSSKKECPFCDRGQPPVNVVYADDHWLVRHSAETNILGYFVIEAKRHIVDLSEATDGEAKSYGCVLAALSKTIRAVTGCQRVYTFSLGEMVEHFHLHVIPRGEAIPRVYRGRGILSYPTVPAADAQLTAEVSTRVARRMARLLPQSVLLR